jgi:hypothetical protein
MSHHLTEAEIQTLIDEGTTSPHLLSCESCRTVFHQYRSLYGRLTDEPEWTLPADFARKVTARAFPKPVSIWPKAIKSVLILAGCAAALELIQNFIGLFFFRQGLVIVTSLFHSTWTVGLSALKMVQSGFGKGSGMILQAGFVLLTLSALDRMWRRVRQG